jgi:hypothetical protein
VYWGEGGIIDNSSVIGAAFGGKNGKDFMFKSKEDRDEAQRIILGHIL